MTSVQVWYIKQMANNDNAKPLLDMLSDMRRIKNGVFSATMKINEGNICDYMLMENEVYAEPSGTKNDKVSGRRS